MTTKKKTGIFVASLALTAGIFLTGCSGVGEPVPSATPKATASVDTKATAPLTDRPSESALELDGEATPTAVETVKDDEINRQMRAGKNTALDVDVDAAYAQFADSQVKQSFTEAQAKEGAQFALNFLHDINTVGNFYEARDGSKDIDLIDNDFLGARIDATLLDSITKDIKKDGYFTYIPSVQPDGTVKTGKDLDLSLTGLPTYTYKTPAIEAVDMGEAGTGVMVDGMRTDHYSMTKGYTASQEVNYWVVAVPSGEDWKVINLGYDSENAELTKAGDAK